MASWRKCLDNKERRTKQCSRHWLKQEQRTSYAGFVKLIDGPYPSLGCQLSGACPTETETAERGFIKGRNDDMMHQPGTYLPGHHAMSCPSFSHTSQCLFKYAGLTSTIRRAYLPAARQYDDLSYRYVPCPPKHRRRPKTFGKFATTAKGLRNGNYCL